MSEVIKRIRQANRLCEFPNILNMDDRDVKLVNPLRIPPITFTDAEVRGANVSPPVVVAGIAGFILIPFSASWILQVGSAFSANVAWALRYQDLALDLHGTLTPTLNAPGYFNSIAQTFVNVNSSQDVRGRGLVWRAASTLTGGALTMNKFSLSFLAVEL